MWKTRSGVGSQAFAMQLRLVQRLVGGSAGSAFRPARPCSKERIAFCSDSGKVRPMAITSPTDCIRVPSRSRVPGSFSNAQRGIFVTT